MFVVSRFPSLEDYDVCQTSLCHPSIDLQCRHEKTWRCEWLRYKYKRGRVEEFRGFVPSSSHDKVFLDV